MTAYGKPYTVRWWDPKDIVITVDCEDPAPEGFTWVMRDPGPVILVPTAALTPVDTTPAEPEPGAYQLGNLIVVVDNGGASHFYIDPLAPDLCGWKPWRELVVFPGVGDPVRLVPAPAAVELPFEAIDIAGCTHRVGVTDDMVTDEAGNQDHAFLPEDAEAKGRALLTAARAAREATS